MMVSLGGSEWAQYKAGAAGFHRPLLWRWIRAYMMVILGGSEWAQYKPGAVGFHRYGLRRFRSKSLT